MEREQEREWKWEDWVKKKEERERRRRREAAFEKDNEERERRRRRREEVLIHEREWEERMNRRRSEWNKRMDDMLGHHASGQRWAKWRLAFTMSSKILRASYCMGIVASQWTARPAGPSDHTGASNHYLSQMMQNLHHANSLDHDDARVDEDNQDDQFIVDG